MSGRYGGRDVPDLLDLLFSFLDQKPPIDPSNSSYFCKVVVVLITKKHPQLINYIQRTNQLEKMLTHIGLYSVMELLIRIGWDDGGGNAGLEQHDFEPQDRLWLQRAGLVPRLLAKLDPKFESQVHS